MKAHVLFLMFALLTIPAQGAEPQLEVRIAKCHGLPDVGLESEDSSTLPCLEVRVGGWRNFWETFVHTEVSHEQEVYCASDGEGTSRAG